MLRAAVAEEKERSHENQRSNCLHLGFYSDGESDGVSFETGVAHPGEGWTKLIVTPQRGIRAVNAMITGLHEPCATHLAMLEALAGLEHLKITYREALRERYLWHEFGDVHLILS